MPLQFQPLTPKEFFASCNKDYAESKISELEEFKEKVAQYLESLDKHKKQNEKAIVANVLAPFLLDLGFQAQAAYKHKGNSEIDLALLKDSQVEILIEAKTQKNKTEMFSAENPNCKALHECILYYLRERENNNAIKYILITDFYQFYLFRAKEFERYFYKNKKIQDAYKSLNKKDLLENQKDFYAELAKILSKDFQGNLEEDATLQGTHFDLRNDKHLESASKLLSRELLHNEFHRDSNALNPKFYYELLHILGLKEIETKGKILIQIDEAQKSSFAKHIASKLESQNQPSDFETTMSHIILWLNRILFLKLIEANLLHFNNFDNFDKNLRFLTSTKITSFSILAHLFFEVLAKDYAERKQDKGFNFLPYLNSSLFIRDEKEICDLSALDDALEILPFATTQTEYKKREPVRFLTYLFDFLECFDFGKSQDSTPSDKLINSSVLGAMFEKLNGYQEGSFYTPNFITSYMCKESLQKIVLEKFNTAFDWDAKDLESLRKQIDRNFSEKEADFKRLLESIRICDPSVGSGHFLVSALNEMIGIYHHLGLLGFGYKSLEVQDDEILLTTKEGVRFAYKRLEDENHQIQISLFNLKKSIIENNLFGVDINPNSCNIARLRLWIELLKNAYYLNFSKDQDCKIHKLQTLPNIDINIKCGNSLISRFNLSDSLRTIPNINFQIEQYKKLVFEYKNADQNLMTISKKDIEKQIETIQATFTLTLKDPKTKRELEKAIESHIKQFNNYLLDDESLLEGLGSLQFNLFGTPTLSEEEQERALESYGKIQTLRKKLTLALSGAEYKNAFEWRFAFPEVLDSNGDFLGFDLVIGNPPYIRQEEIKHLKPQLQKAFSIYKGTSDIYTYFYEQGYKILSPNGTLSFITSNKWCRAAYGEPLRKFLLENTTINTYLDLNGIKVFESATVDTSILEFYKAKASENHALNYDNPKDYNPKDEKPLLPQYSKISQNALSSESFIFSDSKLAALKAKIESIGTPLKDWDINIYRGILTGYNEAFIIDSTKREEILKACKDENERARTEELIKPILRGRDIKRYSYEWAGLWIINTHNGYKDEQNNKIPPIDINEYPTLKAYFDKVANSAKQGKGKGFYDRDDKGITPYNLRNCAYLPEFAKPKIVYSEIVREPQFYLDNGEFKFGYFYAEATSFILSGNKNFKSSLEYLLGLLHSKLCTFAFKEFYAGGGLGESGYRYKKAFLENLPIPKIAKKQEKEFVELVKEIVQTKQIGGATLVAHNEQTKILESKLDSMVYKLYGLDNEEIAIIGGGQHKIAFALLLVSAIRSRLLELVKITCENFESELKEAFRFCEGLQVPQKQYEGKIIWAEMTNTPCFAYDTQGFYINQTCYFILTDDKYLYATLNSKLIYFYMRQMASSLGDGAFRWIKQFIEKLPIPKITESNQHLVDRIVALVNEILNLKAKDTSKLESEIDSLIYKLYNFTDDEIKIIER